MRSLIPISIIASLLTIPLFAQAEIGTIQPELIDTAHSVEEALQTHKGHASTSIEGKGGTLIVTYGSSQPLEVFMVPLQEDNTYVPTDYIRFTLPMATEASVAIDLTISPGWAPVTQKWLLSLLSSDEKTDAGFSSIQFEDASLLQWIPIAFRHFFTREPYTPSSYHALRGYRIFGTSFTILLGTLTLLAACCSLFLQRKYRTKTVFFILIFSSLFYEMRFALDLLRFDTQHLQEYYGQNMYDEAGSIHEIAIFLRSHIDEQKQATAYVCRDGTNFKEKLLRYFSYPIRISSQPIDAKQASFVLIMGKFKEGYEMLKTSDPAVHLLKCGDFDGLGKLLKQFPDGTLLFQTVSSVKTPV